MEHPFLSEVERRNLEDRDTLEASAAALRERMISSAFDGLKIYWRKQLEGFDRIAKAGNPKDAVFEHYVLDDNGQGMPFDGDTPVGSLTLLLRPDPSLGTADEDKYMRIFVPVPEDTTPDETLDIDDLPQPDRIGIELGSAEGVHAKYVIGKDKVTPFVAAFDSGDQAVEEEVLYEHLDWVYKRVDTGMPITSLLFENFTNWSAVVQREELVGEQDTPIDTQE